MHIPDNYLSPQTCAVMTAAVLPAWAVSIRRIRTQLPKSAIPMMGVGAAFSFLGMMFNIPMPGGTTGHAVGGTLIAMLLGPYAACIAVSAALLLQALLFGDGGVLAFGANCFNMAFVLPFAGYAAAKLVSSRLSGKNRDLIGAAVGSYIGINAAALCAAIEFGIQPMLFRNAAGQALYCPYDLSVAVPAMMAGHLTVFGAAEVIYTVAILAFIKSAAPGRDFLHESAGPGAGVGASAAGSGTGARTPLGVKWLLGALIIATPLGLLAEGTAWGEWGADEIAATGAGYTPAGMLGGFSLETMIPDYSVAGLPDWVGYILSAVIGAAILLILFKLLAAVPRSRRAHSAG